MQFTLNQSSNPLTVKILATLVLPWSAQVAPSDASAQKESIASALWEAHKAVTRHDSLKLRLVIDGHSPEPLVIEENRLRRNPVAFSILSKQAVLREGEEAESRAFLNTEAGTFLVKGGQAQSAERIEGLVRFPSMIDAFEQAMDSDAPAGTAWEMQEGGSYFGQPCRKIVLTYPELSTEERTALKEQHRKRAEEKGEEFDAGSFSQIAKTIYYLALADSFPIGYETYSDQGELVERLTILEYELNGPIDPQLFALPSESEGETQLDGMAARKGEPR